MATPNLHRGLTGLLFVAVLIAGASQYATRITPAMPAPLDSGQAGTALSGARLDAVPKLAHRSLRR